MKTRQEKYNASIPNEDEIQQLARQTARALIRANVPHRGPTPAGPKKMTRKLFWGLSYEATIQSDGGTPRFWVVGQYIERGERYVYSYNDQRSDETHTQMHGLAILLTPFGELLVADLKFYWPGRHVDSLEPEELPNAVYSDFASVFEEGGVTHLDKVTLLENWQPESPAPGVNNGRSEVWRESFRKEDERIVVDRKGAGLITALKKIFESPERMEPYMATVKRCPECNYVMLADPGKDEPKGTWFTYVCQNGDCASVKRGHPHKIKEFVPLR